MNHIMFLPMKTPLLQVLLPALLHHRSRRLLKQKLDDISVPGKMFHCHQVKAWTHLANAFLEVMRMCLVES